MKRRIAAFIVLAAVSATNVLIAEPMKKEQINRIVISQDSGVQKTAKWAVSNFWEKSLMIRVDDTSAATSDSCGLVISLWGFSRNTSDYAAVVYDSSRLAFSATSRIFHTTYDTVRNAKNEVTTNLIDTAIVINSAALSNEIDGICDIVQITTICCIDSLQVWVTKNTFTKDGNPLLVDIRLNQINPKGW